MRNTLFLSLLAAAAVSASPSGVAAQGQPPPAPKPATPPAAQAPKTAGTPAPRRAAPASSRGGMAITVTDPKGSTIGGVTVSADGPTSRNGETNPSGQVNFPGLLAGTYRLHFEGDGVVAFEREVTVRNGQVLDVDVALTPAKKMPAPPPEPVPVAPAPAAAPTGPTGEPQFLSVPKVLEAEFVGKNPRRESLLSCSGNTRATMLQINQPMPERRYADADVVYYVIAGEGTLRLDGKETRLALNDFVSIPRGGSHSFERRGNRTLILLSVLGGEACDAAK